MPQHFLLSSKAKTLSLSQVLRMTDAEAYAQFKAIRFAQNQGKPFCPKCGCVEAYEYTTCPLFKCKACRSRFSITSGTLFHSRKLSMRDILGAIALYANGAKGHSALQLSRDLKLAYKTSFVLLHKIREALGDLQKGVSLSGTVEVDGCHVGGHVRPANYKADRIDRRLKENQSGKRRVVVVMRERDGRTVTEVFRSEDEAVPAIMQRVAEGSVIHADEASAWDALVSRYEMKRINHGFVYSHDGACTNQAESFFNRLCRAEAGIHHHIRRQYLSAYAAEMAWREDHRRISNGEQYRAIVTAAAKHPVSRQWKGYWQRRAA